MKYVSEYKKKANQLAKRGYQMYDDLMDVTEYTSTYLALRTDQKQEVALGMRKKAGNILRDLINDQAYKFTKKQAERQLLAAKQFGYRTNIQKLMAGDSELGKIIDEQKQLLKENGYSNKEIALIISQEYFGSA